MAAISYWEPLPCSCWRWNRQQHNHECPLSQHKRGSLEYNPITMCGLKGAVAAQQTGQLWTTHLNKAGNCIRQQIDSAVCKRAPLPFSWLASRGPGVRGLRAVTCITLKQARHARCIQEQTFAAQQACQLRPGHLGKLGNLPLHCLSVRGRRAHSDREVARAAAAAVPGLQQAPGSRVCLPLRAYRYLVCDCTAQKACLPSESLNRPELRVFL